MFVPRSLRTHSVRFQSKAVPTSSAVAFESMFGNFFMTFSSTVSQGQMPPLSWKFGSDLRILVNSMEIIFCSCEFLSLHPTAYHRLSQTGMSSGSELSFSFFGGWRALGLPMHGLADSDWPGCSRSGDDGGVIYESATICRPMPAWNLLVGLERRLCLLSQNEHPVLLSLVIILLFDVSISQLSLGYAYP